jgi:hypothetical protein
MARSQRQTKPAEPAQVQKAEPVLMFGPYGLRCTYGVLNATMAPRRTSVARHKRGSQTLQLDCRSSGQRSMVMLLCINRNQISSQSAGLTLLQLNLPLYCCYTPQCSAAGHPVLCAPCSSAHCRYHSFLQLLVRCQHARGIRLGLSGQTAAVSLAFPDYHKHSAGMHRASCMA